MNVTLILFKEDGEVKEFPIEAEKTVVGRREECDIRIPLAEISRKHAIVIIKDNTVTIRDLGSSNGTYVNNKKVSEQELAPGDHVVVGPVVFTVQINGEPADLKPVHTRLESRKSLGQAASVSSKTPGREQDVDQEDFFGEDDDPITALEALAASDETAAIDMSDSDMDADDPNER